MECCVARERRDGLVGPVFGQLFKGVAVLRVENGVGGVGGRVLELDDVGVPFWIRCPLVPGLNDTDDDLAALRDFIATLRHAEKVEICPYHPLGLEKYAKFGKTPPYTRHEAASQSDISRWGAWLTKS